MKVKYVDQILLNVSCDDFKNTIVKNDTLHDEFVQALYDQKGYIKNALQEVFGDYYPIERTKLLLVVIEFGRCLLQCNHVLNASTFDKTTCLKLIKVLQTFNLVNSNTKALYELILVLDYQSIFSMSQCIAVTSHEHVNIQVKQIAVLAEAYFTYFSNEIESTYNRNKQLTCLQKFNFCVYYLLYTLQRYPKYKDSEIFTLYFTKNAKDIYEFNIRRKKQIGIGGHVYHDSSWLFYQDLLVKYMRPPRIQKQISLFWTDSEFKILFILKRFCSHQYDCKNNTYCFDSILNFKLSYSRLVRIEYYGQKVTSQRDLPKIVNVLLTILFFYNFTHVFILGTNLLAHLAYTLQQNKNDTEYNIIQNSLQAVKTLHASLSILSHRDYTDRIFGPKMTFVMYNGKQTFRLVPQKIDKLLKNDCTYAAIVNEIKSHKLKLFSENSKASLAWRQALFSCAYNYNVLVKSEFDCSNYYLLHMLSTLYYRIVMYLDLPYDMYLNENYFPNQNFDYEGQALFQYTVYDMYEFQINQKTNKTKLN